MVFSDRLLAIHRQGAKSGDISLREEFPQRLGQAFLIVLDRQKIAAALIGDFLGDPGLATNGIDRDDATLERQHIQQRLDLRNLMAFAPGSLRPRRRPLICWAVFSPSREPRTVLLSNPPSCRSRQPSRRSSPECTVRKSGIEYPEDSTKGVMGRRTTLKHQIPAQPSFVVPGPLRYSTNVSAPQSTAHSAIRIISHRPRAVASAPARVLQPRNKVSVNVISASTKIESRRDFSWNYKPMS